MKIEKFTSYRVSGNTFAFKDDLKSLGARWDKPSKTWIVQVGGMSAVGQARFILDRCQQGGCYVEEIQR
jgi:hypothetical protein